MKEINKIFFIIILSTFSFFSLKAESKNLSIGDLLIFYGKTKIANETIEYLEITSPEMLDFTVGERVMNATG